MFYCYCMYKDKDKDKDKVKVKNKVVWLPRFFLGYISYHYRPFGIRVRTRQFCQCEFSAPAKGPKNGKMGKNAIA